MVSGRNARRLQWRFSASRTAFGSGIVLAGLLFASESLQNAVANGDTRSLTMHHSHTGEDITVTFKRDGRYDDEGLKKLNWFLRDWRRDAPTRMDPKLFDIVWEVYRETGGRQPVQIISAYRSPETNSMLRRRGRGVARYSQHMAGRAMDFSIPGVALDEIRAAGLRLQRGGVGFYPTSGSPFVHLDTGSVRHWPRMTRDQLARVFPNGKTVHMPTDGRPLAGYAVAVAEVQQRGGTTTHTAADTETETSDTGLRFGDKSKRFFAKLFGFRGDEDEDATEVSANSKKTAPQPAPAPVMTASKRVPLPSARPGSIEQNAAAAPARAQSGGFALASASSAPVEIKPQRSGGFALASAASAPVEINLNAQRIDGFALSSASPRPAESVKQAPSDVINARGMWRSGDSDAAAVSSSRSEEHPPRPPADIAASGTRLVWVTGPQGQSINRSERNPGERGSETTAGIAPWPMAETKHIRDRVPAEVALAYAADAASPAAPKPAPMGTLRPAWQHSRPQPAVPVVSQSPAAKPAPVTAKAGQRYNDPWLRGVVMAPSVHYSMSVVVFGSVDYRGLKEFMIKPSAIVAMAFSPDPNLGMSSLSFGGAAVNFVPTIHFGQHTARLN